MSIQSLVEQMTLDEKLEAMELLWASLSRSKGRSPPEWHRRVLAEREKEAQDPANIETWEEAKRKIREQLG
jgi:hypothetical protein